MDKKGLQTLIGIDNNGHYAHVDTLDVRLHFGNGCGLFHMIDKTPLCACSLNSSSKTRRHLRHINKMGKGNPSGGCNESDLHFFVKNILQFFNDINSLK